jgi:hypothetical protein
MYKYSIHLGRAANLCRGLNQVDIAIVKTPGYSCG